MAPVVRTSTSHPIEVGWLAGPGPGAVGLTIAPGKREGLSLHHYSYVWQRDLETDLRRLRHVERADVLVCLLEPRDLERYAIPNLVARAKHHGLRVLRCPIPDGWLPASPQAVAKLLDNIRKHVNAGRRVVIHCAGGLGRSGVIGGCYLRSRGDGPGTALAKLVAARGPRCPENLWQSDYVRQWPNVSGVAPPCRAPVRTNALP